MPYIEQTKRDAIDSGLVRPATTGELNYAITKLCVQYWIESPRSYQIINDIVGAVESAKAEFQRRVVQKYEDSKIAANGDVY